MQRLGLCSLLAVPWQQVFNAGKQIQGVLPGAAVSGVQRERAAALPGLRLTGTATPEQLTGTMANCGNLELFDLQAASL